MLDTIFSLIVLFLSISIHELSHAIAAFRLGDPTAKLEGRISLNPVRHIDPFGTILVPLFLWIASFGQGPIFGWAKPVPVNPFLLRDQKFGMLKVSLAGPLSNLLIGIFFAIFCRLLPKGSGLFPFFYLISIYNFILAFFNLLPIPPLDGFHVFQRILPQIFKTLFLQYGFLILILVLFLGLNFIFFFAHFLFDLISGSKTIF